MKVKEEDKRFGYVTAYYILLVSINMGVGDGDADIIRH